LGLLKSYDDGQNTMDGEDHVMDEPQLENADNSKKS
jgi:hypothetical protein